MNGRTAGVVLTAAGAWVVLLGTGWPSAVASSRVVQRQARQAPCATAPDQRRSIFVPLAHLRFFGAADLMLNNRGVRIERSSCPVSLERQVTHQDTGSREDAALAVSRRPT